MAAEGIRIRREEYRYYTGEAWHARNTHGGVDADDMAALLKICRCLSF